MIDKITSKQWLGLVGISLLCFTCFLDVTIVSNALPAIRESLSASDTELQWLVNTIYVALCALMATIGRMGDVLGLRKIFYICMIIMALASFACGISTSIEQLIVFRAIQGITFASITISFALIAHNFPADSQPKAMSICSAIAGTGLAIGPVIGGLIVEYLNWRWIFFINVPIVALGITICLFCVNEKKQHDTSQTVDWLGAFLFIIAISSLVTTVIEAPNWGFNNPLTWGGFALAIVSFILFVITERKVAMPLMPFSRIANLVFIPAALTCFTCGAFIAVLLFFNPLYLQTILNFTPEMSGWILFSASLAYVLMSPVAAYITKRFNPKMGTWMVCLLLMCAALCHAYFGLQANLLLILLGLITFGMAWGMVNVPPVVAVLHNVKPNQSAVMLGALWTLFNLGSCIVLAFVGLIFRWVEYRFLLKQLGNSSLSGSDLQLLHTLVIEPEQSAEIINRFPHDIASQIMPAYKTAFVQSFDIVMWILFAIATSAFIVVFFFMKDPTSQRKSAASA